MRLVHRTNHAKSRAGGKAYNLSITCADVEPVLFSGILQMTKRICPSKSSKVISKEFKRYLCVDGPEATCCECTLPPVPCCASASVARRWLVWQSLRWWRGGCGDQTHKLWQREWNCPLWSLCCRARTRCGQVLPGGDKNSLNHAWLAGNKHKGRHKMRKGWVSVRGGIKVYRTTASLNT